jgi:hypothetical protein
MMLFVHTVHSVSLIPIYSYTVTLITFRVKWVHCHHKMASPRVADRGDGLQIWRVAANILNKQSSTADSGWSSRLGDGRGLTTLPRKTDYHAQHRNRTDYLAQPKHRKVDLRFGTWNVRSLYKSGSLGRLAWGCELDSTVLGQWRAVVSAVMNLRVLASRS